MKCNPAAYILENNVKHSRLLPIASAHAFSYPTLSFLLPLSALESHELDLGDGWIFGYNESESLTSHLSVTSLRQGAYLTDVIENGSIRTKLLAVLERYGHDPLAFRDAWIMTMPRYMGFEGINPLTVYYCYAHGSDDLWIIVLEVHNTFGEQHTYVLPTGPGHEDKIIGQGFDHGWTFARQFHVSPFNDRSGFYTCALAAPPRPPYASLIKTGATLRAPPSVRIELRTAQTRKLKLIATLRPTRVTSLTTRNLFLALSRQPFSLFLSFTRIVWHAAVLHYRRRLDVYIRPEPRAVNPKLEKMIPGDLNEIQSVTNNGELGVGGGTGWQPEGFLERYARNIVETFIMQRALDMDISVILQSSNPTYGRKCFPSEPDTDRDTTGSLTPSNHLYISFRSSRFFTIMLLCPSAAHALLLGCDAERVFSVSDEALFLSVFTVSDSQAYSPDLRRVIQKRRLMDVPPSLRAPRSDMKAPSVHPLDASLPFFSALLNLFVVIQFLAVQKLERMLFTLFRARFVPGTEPWGGWLRAEEVVWKTNRTKAVAHEDDEFPSLGSYRRP